MARPQQLQLAPEGKLLALRELDEFRFWHSLDDERFCGKCGQTITGRQIAVLEMRNKKSKRSLECPTKNCPAQPGDWAYADAIATAVHFRAHQALEASTDHESHR
ncbi:MAG: hypothetical protein ACR2HH_00355 [Chthoniobacterales bacterium]